MFTSLSNLIWGSIPSQPTDESKNGLYDAAAAMNAISVNNFVDDLSAMEIGSSDEDEPNAAAKGKKARTSNDNDEWIFIDDGKLGLRRVKKNDTWFKVPRKNFAKPLPRNHVMKKYGRRFNNLYQNTDRRAYAKYCIEQNKLDPTVSFADKVKAWQIEDKNSEEPISEVKKPGRPKKLRTRPVSLTDDGYSEDTKGRIRRSGRLNNDMEYDWKSVSRVKGAKKDTDLNLTSSKKIVNFVDSEPEMIITNDDIEKYLIKGEQSTSEKMDDSNEQKENSSKVKAVIEKVKVAEVPKVKAVIEKVKVAEVPNVKAVIEKVKVAEVPKVKAVIEKVKVAEVPKVKAVIEKVKVAEVPKVKAVNEKVKIAEVPRVENIPSSKVEKVKPVRVENISSSRDAVKVRALFEKPKECKKVTTSKPLWPVIAHPSLLSQMTAQSQKTEQSQKATQTQKTVQSQNKPRTIHFAYRDVPKGQEDTHSQSIFSTTAEIFKPSESRKAWVQMCKESLWPFSSLPKTEETYEEKSDEEDMYDFTESYTRRFFRENKIEDGIMDYGSLSYSFLSGIMPGVEAKKKFLEENKSSATTGSSLIDQMRERRITRLRKYSNHYEEPQMRKKKTANSSAKEAEPNTLPDMFKDPSKEQKEKESKEREDRLITRSMVMTQKSNKREERKKMTRKSIMSANRARAAAAAGNGRPRRADRMNHTVCARSNNNRKIH